MKTNAIVRIVLFSIAILILLGILFLGLFIGLFTFNTEDDSVQYIEQDHSFSSDAAGFSADEIQDIQIEWAAGTITMQPGDTDTIEVTEYGSGEPMVIRQTGDKLVIKFSDVNTHFGITIDYSKDLVITVPRDWVCGELEMDVASAQAEISDLHIRNVDFDGASGNCTFDNCTVDTLDIDTASGDIHYNGSLNSLECDAASADCVLVLLNTPSRIDLDGMSGDLDITLPEGSGFAVSMDGLSSEFSSDFEFTIRNGRYVYGDGSCVITVDAMSGDVMIRRGN